MTSVAVTAVAPELIAILKAAQTFVANLGVDPLKLPLTAGPALAVFVGQVSLQVAPAVNAEWSVVQTEVNSQLAGLIAKLTPAPAAPAA